MTETELTEQTITTFAAWKKDPKTPLEFLRDDGKWCQSNSPDWLFNHYRIAPFTLGNSINGHTLGEGEQWHRVDGWTADMLPAPYRPLIAGEELVRGEPLRYGTGMQDVVCGIAGETTAEHEQCHFTTTRPLPSALICPGHNPDKLTCAQVGTKDGWRLLDADEAAKFDMEIHGVSMPTNRWEKGTKTWNDNRGLGFYGVLSNYTYRTRLTREELAALDAPPAAKKPEFRDWNCAEDVPCGVVYVRHRDGQVDIVTEVDPDGVKVTGSRKFLWQFCREYSTDRKTWHPCTVPV